MGTFGEIELNSGTGGIGTGTIVIPISDLPDGNIAVNIYNEFVVESIEVWGLED
jgi:hypothetical protein